MGKVINITGKKFGKLTAIEYIGRSKWLCRCGCGTLCEVNGYSLRSGNTKSCGCLQKEHSPQYEIESDGSITLRNLIGERFGSLVVTEFLGRNKNGEAMWLCKCDCGKTCKCSGSSLFGGNSRSCGCKKPSSPEKCHWGSKTRLYGVYKGMLTRCYNENNHAYKNYGARGIKVCDEWLHNFPAFRDWALAHGYDENAPRNQCTINRIDNDGDYSPDNCEFATASEQNRNRRRYSNPKQRRSVVEIDDNGLVRRRFSSVTDAADAFGVSLNSVVACCRHRNRSTKGHRLVYADEFREEMGLSGQLRLF